MVLLKNLQSLAFGIGRFKAGWAWFCCRTYNCTIPALLFRSTRWILYTFIEELIILSILCRKAQGWLILALLKNLRSLPFCLAVDWVSLALLMRGSSPASHNFLWSTVPVCLESGRGFCLWVHFWNNIFQSSRPSRCSANIKLTVSTYLSSLVETLECFFSRGRENSGLRLGTFPSARIVDVGLQYVDWDFGSVLCGNHGMSVGHTGSCA